MAVIVILSRCRNLQVAMAIHSPVGLVVSFRHGRAHARRKK